MRFVIDLDSLELIESATDRRRVSLVEGKRGDDAPFEVIFVRSGVAEELAASSVLTFGAKQENKYDANAVVLDDSFAKSGSGTAAKYLANPSFNTTALNALFAIDANDTNDPPYVDLMAEFAWQVGTGAPTSTKTFRYRVHNDVIRGDEVGPVEITGGTPVNQAFASLEIEFDILPTAGDILTIESDVTETWEFVTGTPSGGEIQIGATLADCAANLAAVLGSTAVDAAQVGSTPAVILTAYVGGTAGNAITVTSSNTGLFGVDLDAEPLAGGVDATAGRLGTMKVASGFLYIVDSVTSDVPTWKKIALSAL
jgi:hypothetical protein